MLRFSVGNGHVKDFRAIAVLADNEGVVAAFDGSVEVTSSVRTHFRTVMVVAADSHQGTADRLTCDAVGDGSLHSVKDLLDVGQHAVVVDVPEIGQLRGVRSLVVGAFDGHFAALCVIIHVVLTASVDGVPRVSIDDAVVVLVHVVRTDFMREVGIFVANQLPPGIVGMEGLVSVPGIVHHLGAAMVVGTHREEVFLCNVHHPLALVLVIGLSVGVRAVIKVGEVAVEVDVVGIVARGTINAVVAAMIGAVGVGAREDEEVDIVQNVGDALLVAGAELVDEA